MDKIPTTTKGEKVNPKPSMTKLPEKVVRRPSVVKMDKDEASRAVTSPPAIAPRADDHKKVITPVTSSPVSLVSLNLDFKLGNLGKVYLNTKAENFQNRPKTAKFLPK